MEEFTVFGAGFGTNTGNISFRYYNQGYLSGNALIVSWSDSEITAKVPAVKKGSYRIQVMTSDGKKSNEVRFSVKNGRPIINSTSFSNSNGEIEITFGGREFGRRGSIDIYNGSNLAGNGVIEYWSSSRVRFEVPSLPENEYGFQITTSDGRKSSFKYFTAGN